MQRNGCEACWALEASDAYEAVTRVPVDWEDGDDPIHRTIIPIDKLERASLMDGNSVDARTIEQVRAGRRNSAGHNSVRFFFRTEKPR